MSRSARLSLAAAAGAVALVMVPVPAVAEDVTVASGTASVVNGPPGSPAIDLQYDVYVPAGASPVDPRPAIVMTHGFGLSKDAPEVTSMASFLSRNGYVVLAYTAAGFDESGGCITLQSIDRDAVGTTSLVDQVLEPRTDLVRDGGELVLGTVGGSYGGGWQLPYAALDDRVRAAAPGRTWSLLRYSLNPNNRVVPGDPTGFTHALNEQGVFKAQWTSLFFAAGNGEPVGGIPPTGELRTACQEYKLAGGDSGAVSGITCTGYLSELCDVFARVSTTGTATAEDRELLDRASGATFLGELGARRLPVLLVQGQRDTLFNPNDALTTYTALRAAGSPVEMVWNWGGHGGYNSRAGECEVYGGGTGAPEPSPDGVGLEDCYLTARTLAFFDRHLLPGAAADGDAPGFAWYREWTGFAEGADGTFAADEQYGTAPQFPAMPSTTFTLSGDRLVPPGGVVAQGSAQLLNPLGGSPSSYSETSNFSGPDSTPRDPREPYDLPGQSATFTSPPFPAAVESVGVPRAQLALAHEAPTDLFLFAKAYDVAPDGSAELIARMVSPVRVPTADLDRVVDVNLIGFAHRFEAGHRVRLVLTTTDTAYRNNPVADVITLQTGPASTLALPLPAGTVVPPEAPPTAPGAPPAQADRQLAETGAGPALPAAAALLAVGAVLLRRRLTRH
ncbi:MAG: CocE/NonD family hydrolase C-terminal non-catalytic domain-containing protein [Actinomycetes bacterium]